MKLRVSLAIACAAGMLALAVFGPALLGADGQTTPPAGGALAFGRLWSFGTLAAALIGLAQIATFLAAWDGHLSSRRYLLATWALTVGLTFALLAACDAGGFSLAKETYFQGYAQDAARFENARAVLASYHAEHATLSPHAQTHPPGPVLFARGLGQLAGRLAELPGGDLGFSNRAVAEVALRGNLTGGLLILLAWSWLWPLDWLVRSLHAASRADAGAEAAPRAGERAGSVAVALGATMPSLLLVAPWIDILFPSLVLASAALAWKAALAPTRRARAGLGAGAGLAAAALLFFGFGNLITLPILFAVAALATSAAHANLRTTLGTLCALALGLLGAYALLLGLGYDFVEGLFDTLRFHASGVNQARAYAPSLLASPYVFLLWLGAPIALGAGAWLGRRDSSAATRLARLLAVLLALLVVSGVTRGETERLWLTLAPFLVCLAGLTWAPLAGRRAVLLIATNLITAFVLLALTGQYA